MYNLDVLNALTAKLAFFMFRQRYLEKCQPNIYFFNINPVALQGKYF